MQFHVAYTDTRNTRRDGINEVNWWESMGSSLRDILLLSAPKGKYANLMRILTSPSSITTKIINQCGMKWSVRAEASGGVVEAGLLP